MAGRPAKPRHLKLVTGNPGKRALKNEPAPPRSTGETPPPYLSARAVECWHRVAPMLDKMGVLTAADEMSLSELAEAFSDIQEARASLANPVEVLDAESGEFRIIAEAGAVTYTTKSKEGWMVRTRPEVATIEAASRRLHALFGQFGLTPAARSKINLAEKPSADPLDGYFG